MLATVEKRLSTTKERRRADEFSCGKRSDDIELIMTHYQGMIVNRFIKIAWDTFMHGYRGCPAA